MLNRPLFFQERAINTEVVQDKSKAKRRKLERELAGAIKPKNVLPKDAFRVEHLNYKRLVPTTKLLAQIIIIRPLELIVSLPNQLLGHIPITNISSEYTARLEEEGDDSSEEESDEDSDEEDKEKEPKSVGLPALNELYAVGQWVSAIVVSSGSTDSKAKIGGRTGDENVRAAQRIELSTEPEKVNEGIAKGDLRAGFVRYTSSTTRFVLTYVRRRSPLLFNRSKITDTSSRSVSLPSPLSSLSRKRRNFSRLVYKSVKSSAVESRTSQRTDELATSPSVELKSSDRQSVSLSAFSRIVSNALVQLTNATSIASILPATLVTALVTATLSSGLNVKFFGYFDGTIDLFHLNNLDPEKDFKVGQKIKARVLWDSIGSTPKKFSLSLATHVLSMGVARVESGEEGVLGEELVEGFPVGKVLEEVRVVRMDDEWGLTCEILEGENKVPAFVHVRYALCLSHTHTDGPCRARSRELRTIILRRYRNLDLGKLERSTEEESSATQLSTDSYNSLSSRRSSSNPSCESATSKLEKSSK